MAGEGEVPYIKRLLSPMVGEGEVPYIKRLLSPMVGEGEVPYRKRLLVAETYSSILVSSSINRPLSVMM